MNLPNLTELLEKATARPWIVEGGLQDSGERYITAQEGDITVGEVFHTRGPNARLLVLAANNFGAVVNDLVFCERVLRQSQYEDTANELANRLAKIEREAGER